MSGEKYQRPEGSPDWVSTGEDEALVVEAMAFGAVGFVLNSRRNCKIFVSTKRSLRQEGFFQPATVVLHLYHCRLGHARQLKCFRASVYKIAEENLAFMRDGEGSNDGIANLNFFLILTLLIFVVVFFFVVVLFFFIITITFSCNPDEEEYNNEDQKRENKEEVEVRDQRLSVVPFDNAVKIKRVFFYDYLHVSDCDGVPNSPPCDTFSDAGSMSIFEPETVTLSIEKVGQ
eukprot:gene12130-13263_t